MGDDVETYYVYHLLEITTRKMQYDTKVNYVKISFVEGVSSQTQPRFYE